MEETGELATYLRRIDRLTLTDEYDQIKEITKKHWKESEGRKKCSSWPCRKIFSLMDWPHHCRRCGEVFCASCLQYQRRLNKLARPDPNGQSHKVCLKCFEEGKETEGVRRSWTHDFTALRKLGQQNQTAIAKGRGSVSRLHKINLETECNRLIQGFKKRMTRSEVKSTLVEMKNMVVTPDWLKSPIWIQENIAGSCSGCKSVFGILRKKHCCSVCGVAVCASCSNKDLLIFVPDDEDTTEPELAIIRIVGCPAEEPEVSLYLRVCGKCHELMETKQLANYQLNQTQVDSHFLTSLLKLQEKLQTAEYKINKHLPEYKLIVSSLENSSRGGETAGKSNMKILAKAQEDLADYLSQHVSLTNQLKSLKPETSMQSALFKSFIRSKCDYYMNNMSAFRLLGKKLSESSPPEVLEFMQRIINKDAVVSAHLYIRQLIYEALTLCSKYKQDETLPRLLMTVESTVEEDVILCLRKDEEDADKHEELIQHMIKDQLANHKLIRPSKRLLKSNGAGHAKSIMWSRSMEVLQQMSVQLQLKTSNKSFSETKAAINEAIKQVEIQLGSV